MSPTNQLIKPLIDHLHSDGRLRVWSMVITIFGDAIQPRGGVVAMSDLHEILGALGVESGAVRTAMSRLAKEGWVTRQKQGRNSFYKLSEAGLNSFVPATQKIYRAEYAPEPTTILMAVGPNVLGKAREQQNAQIVAMGGEHLRNGVGLFADPTDKVREQIKATGLMSIEGEMSTLPDWVIDKLDLQPLAEAYHGLIDRFTSLAVTREQLDQLTSLEALCARILLVHEWRRLILKQPDLPARLLPQDWPGAAAHNLVSTLYRQLLAPSEKWWSAVSSDSEMETLRRRFENSSHPTPALPI
ncbi:PaaX family transcriptional regulator [Maritalea sp.]|uniref:PaaX family transcriptional regulator n=1 Tax=Maritalea sp. TaxID=2003361 RepID=UPI003EF72E89